MQRRKTQLFLLAAVGALITVGGFCLARVPTSRIKTNGAHLTRSVKLLPPAQWGYHRIHACGGNNSYSLTVYGVVGIYED